jgi:hypothetical protein|tara:strand:+ start:145 stop:519 length:375 start_codon:yes stop_codon:yes gene_type:complete
MNSPFDNIPPQEIQYFKEKVTRWVKVDNQVSELEKQIRELKNVRNKELEPEITAFMNKYNVKDLNTDNGKLRCQEFKTKKGLNKQNIAQNLAEFVAPEKLDDAVNRIITDRPIVLKYKIKKMKR